MKKQQPSKKTTPNKKSNEDDIIKSQLNLFQFCNTLSDKNHILEIEIQKLYTVTNSLKTENKELKRILEMIGKKIGELRDRVSENEEPYIENDEKDEIVGPSRSTPLHDDVTVRCFICEKTYHIKNEKCPYCNYKNKK